MRNTQQTATREVTDDTPLGKRVVDEALLQVLRESGPLTARELAAIVDVGTSGVRSKLRALYRSGKLVRGRLLRRKGTAWSYAHPDTPSDDSLREWEHVDDGTPADTGDLMHDTADCPLVPNAADVVAITRQEALDRLLWPCEECFGELVAIATDATSRPYHATLCLAVTRLATHRFVTPEIARARGADECNLCVGSVDERGGRHDVEWDCPHCPASSSSSTRPDLATHLRHGCQENGGPA